MTSQENTSVYDVPINSSGYMSSRGIKNFDTKYARNSITALMPTVTPAVNTTVLRGSE